MIRFDYRPTPKTIRLIALVERLSGRWDRLERGLNGKTSADSERLWATSAEAALLLDSSAPPLSFFRDENGQARVNKDISSTLSRGFQVDGDDFCHDLLMRLARTIAPEMFESASAEEMPWRTEKDCFLAPSEGDQGQSIVFDTVPPFLVPQRTRELIDWVRGELEIGTYHPLFIIGAFHLMFLQIHPFRTANHRLSLLAVWHLLKNSGYSFVTHAALLPFFERHIRTYFNALRQAERTALQNWSTMNCWMEHFLEAVSSTLEELVQLTEQELDAEHLTAVQKRIIEVVKTHAPATREIIVENTGLNLSTVKYNLGVLSTRGQLKREGGGRSTCYRAM